MFYLLGGKLLLGMVGAEEGGGPQPLVVEEGLQREHAFEETAEKPGVFTGTEGRVVDRGSDEPWEGTAVRRSLAGVGDSDELMAKSWSWVGFCVAGRLSYSGSLGQLQEEGRGQVHSEEHCVLQGV